jgi:phospholipid/cholesterol/gamma-HCH transport system ATP-binding protein
LDPAILFCDEPSAGLDPVTAADLDALILSLRDQFGTTVVVVTHELSSIEAIADQVVMLAGGEVIADGPLSEVKRSTTPTVRSFFGRVANRAADTQTHSLFDRLTL